ncbi:hypothetical protein SAMN05660909_02719 [Chitinophaga terrae (ex Kim and Jung 2007)]|jgi:hypothetical protein|uniref:Phage tail protein n=1 Tax=Chitinophaga terrae (ex Kim and Jung 2007) TaxID=408074 RepID=A0A1H4CQ66_9BACT|nr:type VI secretion system tube protein TssD [Chitinophaga terrae (ex Kim and Jung 2007)]MDQ0105194.1 hypothetical protein [Chitinophaga terrae (ex Kim and Jung 2007)]GEP90385.1 hypothetical protein CTE07_20300 [Chitinophaga terrae (ex Kim and Jung 2007)]SEA62517.1 hypothetical protein SAMN05660909_02719 [Chitinophaga terrae (ex Kim and Jung 2007)]
MSFKATLNIDGEELNILECRFSLSQQVDYSGKPIARPKGGLIHLLVESTGHTRLFDWMISNTLTKSGSIVFFRRDAMSKLKTLQFTDGYCIGYSEKFNAVNEQAMQINLVLSCRELHLNHAVYQNPWP